MILFTVGTSTAPFDRLFRAVERLEVQEPIVAQHGASLVRPNGASWVDFFDFDEFVEHIRRARVVVMHAGVGSVLTALNQGKRPIVVPRLRRYGEAVDDHQLEFGRHASDVGLVTLVEDEAALGDAIAVADGAESPRVEAATLIVADIRSYLEAELGPPGRVGG